MSGNSGPADQPTRDPEEVARDFVARYNQSPSSISPEEAVARYQSVAPQLTPAAHKEVAEEAFARLSQPERLALGKYLIAQAQQQGTPPPDSAFPDVNGDGIDDRLQNPGYLAQVTQQAQQQQPGWLGRILGGIGGSAAGGAPTGPQGGGPSGGFPGGTLGKVALGGIAAAALSRFIGGGVLRGGGHGGGFLGGGGLMGGHGGGHGGGHDDD